MALTRQDLKDIVSLVAQMLNERPMPLGIAGHVVPGSYRKADGTIEVSVDDADAAYQLANALGDSDTTMWLSHPRVPIAGNDPNDQYGPVGGEPVLLLPSQRGFVAKFIPDADSNEATGAGPFFTVKAPSGERWIFHRNAAGDIDSGIQLTNDGPTNGDGLGGTTVGNNGALTRLQTQSGHSVALNDTAQTIAVKTAGGTGGANPLSEIYDDATQTIVRAVSAAIFDKLDLTNQKITSTVAANIASILDAVAQKITHQAGANVISTIDGNLQKITHQSSATVKIIVDGAGNAISHVVPSGGGIGLGGLFSALGAGTAAVNQDLMNNSYSGLINSMVLGNLQAYATAVSTSLQSSGIATATQAGNFASALLAIVVGSWLTKVASFTGSATVKLAS